MSIIENKTQYIESLVLLYHLLIHADGRIDEKELKMGELMKKHEKIGDWEFNHLLDKVSKMDNDETLRDCIASLKKCDYNLQVKCIAWMSLIANSDGFMDPEEWKLIYLLYHKELKLKLSDILEMQKQLPRPN